MPRAWRITKAKHAATALSGEGSFLVGGRWNSRGKRMVYTSQTLSLAALETLIHVDNVGLLADYLYCSIDLPQDIVETLDPSLLSPNWRDDEGLTRAIGDAWVESGRSAALVVPSAVIESEWNYLIHPNHPDFISHPEVRISDFHPFTFDPRLKR